MHDVEHNVETSGSDILILLSAIQNSNTQRFRYSLCHDPIPDHAEICLEDYNRFWMTCAI